MTDDLLPCPFCGSGIAKTIGNASFSGVELMGAGTDRPYVWCGTCGSSGSFEDNDEKAIAAWNRRAIPATDAREAALHRATELKVVRAVDVCNRVLHFDLARMIDFDSDDYNQAVKDAADAAREAYAAILALISANSRTT